MKEITINLEKINKLGMTVSTYLTLLSIAFQENNEYELLQDTHLWGDRDILHLLKSNLIAGDSTNFYSVTEKGKEVLGLGKEDLFIEFYNLFPDKAPVNGGGFRALSTVNPKSTSATKTKQKWNRITRGDVDKQKHIIGCLKKELHTRNKQGDLQYMHNIDTWLNKSYWEHYEDIEIKESNNFEIDI